MYNNYYHIFPTTSFTVYVHIHSFLVSFLVYNEMGVNKLLDQRRVSLVNHRKKVQHGSVELCYFDVAWTDATVDDL